MTPYQRDRLDTIVSEMADGETRLDPMPGIASVTRKDRWEASWLPATDAIVDSSAAEVSAWVERNTVRGVTPADLDQRFHLAANRAE